MRGGLDMQRAFRRKLGFKIIDLSLKLIRPVFGFMGGYPEISDAHNRGYIEDYVYKNRGYIKRADNVLEFAGGIIYSKKYNQNVKYAAWSGHKDRWKGCDYYFDIIDADTLPQEKFDCIVLTEVLNCIIDVNLALENFKKMLTAQGVLIITMHGPVLCNSEIIGFYSRYGAEQLCKRHFHKVFNVQEYGDLNHAIAALMGVGRRKEDESLMAKDKITITTGLCCKK